MLLLWVLFLRVSVAPGNAAEWWLDSRAVQIGCELGRKMHPVPCGRSSFISVAVGFSAVSVHLHLFICSRGMIVRAPSALGHLHTLL